MKQTEGISRFATMEDVFSGQFAAYNRQLHAINKELGLIDHFDLNKERFSWADQIKERPSFYASRMWEYPFAIIAAELQQGLKCADIGCGTTPFTPYLCAAVGAENVTGFDPDYFEDVTGNTHYAFGVSREFIHKTGFNFQADSMDRLRVQDETFDRVFCISVLEHITEPSVWQKGVMEMSRILKPGGRLIITIDQSMTIPFLSPLDLIKYSGLSPVNGLDLKWPFKRFGHIREQAFDVFGLVLEKAKEEVCADYFTTCGIPQWKANRIFMPAIMSNAQQQIAKDLIRRFGSLRVVLKSIAGKYR